VSTVAETMLAAQWRDRAEQLERYAKARRREGDPHEAEDAEAAAVDYRIAADELEAQAVAR
jgi:hypothetical protein